MRVLYYISVSFAIIRPTPPLVIAAIDIDLHIGAVVHIGRGISGM